MQPYSVILCRYNFEIVIYNYNSMASLSAKGLFSARVPLLSAVI